MHFNDVGDEYEAFARGDSERAAASRAAQILSMAEQLTSGNDARREDSLRHAARGTPKLRALDQHELQERLAVKKAGRRRFERSDERHLLHTRAQRGDDHAALELIEQSIDDVSLDVRVSASAASVALDVAGGARVEDLDYGSLEPLVEASRAQGDAADVANAMLDHLAAARKSGRGHARPLDRHDEPLQPRSMRGIRRHPHDQPLSIGVHGTFSRLEVGPLHPAHSFYRGLRWEITSSLYSSGPGRFRWTGRYRAHDRDQGAEDLARWADRAGDRTHLHTVFAHSHGGNVVLDAVERGLVSIDFLVLLGVPAVRRSDGDWERINSGIGRAVAYRAGFDPVISIDRLVGNLGLWGEQVQATGGPEFPPEFKVRQQPAFNGFRLGFSHSGWLNDRIWRSRGLYDDLRHERSLLIGGIDPAPPMALVKSRADKIPEA